MPQFFEGLQSVSDDSFQKILISLMESDPKTVAPKTEIEVPLALAQLKTIAVILRQDGYPDLADIIEEFIGSYLVYMISRNREGRREIIQALTEGLKEDRALREKLTSPPEV